MAVLLAQLAGFVTVEGYLDHFLLRVPVVVVGRVDGRGKDEVVHMGHGEQSGGSSSAREVHDVEVAQGAEDRVDRVAVGREICAELERGASRRPLGEPPNICQERRVRHHGGEAADEASDRERRRAALAVSGDGDPIGIDHRQRADGVDESHAVREQPS